MPKCVSWFDLLSLQVWRAAPARWAALERPKQRQAEATKVEAGWRVGLGAACCITCRLYQQPDSASACRPAFLTGVGHHHAGMHDKPRQARQHGQARLWGTQLQGNGWEDMLRSCWAAGLASACDVLNLALSPMIVAGRKWAWAVLCSWHTNTKKQLALTRRVARARTRDTLPHASSMIIHLHHTAYAVSRGTSARACKQKRGRGDMHRARQRQRRLMAEAAWPRVGAGAPAPMYQISPGQGDPALQVGGPRGGDANSGGRSSQLQQGGKSGSVVTHQPAPQGVDWTTQQLQMSQERAGLPCAG